jgi:hypothetical protein
LASRSYHTNGSPSVSAQLLIDFEKRALNLDNEVLAVFQQQKALTKNSSSKLSPGQVWEILNQRLNNKCLLTSCRRAVTNLTTRGLLRKTKDARLGNFGAMEHLWEINE